MAAIESLIAMTLCGFEAWRASLNQNRPRCPGSDACDVLSAPHCDGTGSLLIIGMAEEQRIALSCSNAILSTAVWHRAAGLATRRDMDETSNEATPSSAKKTLQTLLTERDIDKARMADVAEVNEAAIDKAMRGEPIKKWQAAYIIDAYNTLHKTYHELGVTVEAPTLPNDD